MKKCFLLTLPAVFFLLSCAEKDTNSISLPSANTETAKQAAPEARQAPAAPVATSPAPTGNDTVSYSGTVEAHRRSTLSPKISSVVTRVHVREGDRVKEGDPLVTFDVKDVNLRLRQAKASLDGAKIQNDSAILDWERTKSLLDSNAASRAQFDAVDSRKQGAEVAVAGAQVAVEMGEKAVKDAIVRAPYHGLIVRRLVNEGDYATTMPPSALIVIEETGILDLRILVSSSEFDKIREGDPVTVTFSSLKRSIQAKVTKIVSSIDARTRNFSVIIEIPNPDGALLPGLFAEARFDHVNTGKVQP